MRSSTRQPAHPARPREVRGVRAAVHRGGRPFGSINVQEILAVLSEEGFVHLVDGTGSGRRSPIRPTPSACDRSRPTTSSSSTSTDDERVIGETDFTSGPSTLHEKAIYIVEGQLFQVERLDFDGRKAFVRAVECDYYTDAITHTKVTILETFAAITASEATGPQALATGARAARRACQLPKSAWSASVPDACVRTVKCTSSPASSGSRRSSSIRTRTSDRASWSCPSSRCTRRRTG